MAVESSQEILHLCSRLIDCLLERLPCWWLHLGEEVCLFAEMLQIDQQHLIGETSLDFAESPELSPQFQRLGECGD